MATAVHAAVSQSVSTASHAATELIQSLTARVSELSTALLQLRKEKTSLQGEHEQQLFKERQECEQLALQIQSLNSQVQQKDLIISQLETRFQQQTSLFQLCQRETTALRKQVDEERAQVALLSTQLQEAIQRGNELQNQVLELSKRIEGQNKVILSQLQQIQQSQSSDPLKTAWNLYQRLMRAIVPLPED